MGHNHQNGAIFALLSNWLTKKSKFSQNKKKYLKILLFCTIVPKSLITSSVLPQIKSWQAFSSFWAIFAFLPHLSLKKSKFSKNEKKSLEILLFGTIVPKITIISNAVPQIQCGKALYSFRDIFAAFTPFVAQKSKFSKNTKKSGDTMVLNVHQKSWP